MAERTPPIRVLRIIARLNIGGPAIHVALLTAGLQDAQFESRLVAGQIGPDEGDMADYARSLGVEALIIPSIGREIAPLDDIRAILALLRLMRDYRPQIVHTHTAKAGLLGRVAARLAGVPVVLHTFHGHVFYGYFGPLKTRFFILLEQISALFSDRILTISEGLRGDLLRYHIAGPEKIDVIPLGFDLQPFLDLDARRGEFRRELGVSTEQPLIGIIGRLVPVKDHVLFLEAAARLAAIKPAARFAIVGDGEERAMLEAFVEKLGLREQVIFAGWQREIMRVYADLDLVVLSSRNEGTPVSLIEAMSSGVPVVATAVGGTPDLLGQGRYGRLVPVREAQALAEAMRETLDTDRRTQVAEARAYVLARFGSERLLADMRGLYLDLLRKRQLV